jgi:hypothetical protein
MRKCPSNVSFNSSGDILLTTMLAALPNIITILSIVTAIVSRIDFVFTDVKFGLVAADLRIFFLCSIILKLSVMYKSIEMHGMIPMNGNCKEICIC